MIPFVRNMIEFGVDKNVGGITGISSDYVLLTHLLHEKDKTKLIRFSDLKKIYKKYLGIKNFKSDVVESNLVIDEIFNIPMDIPEKERRVINELRTGLSPSSEISRTVVFSKFISFAIGEAILDSKERGILFLSTKKFSIITKLALEITPPMPVL